MIGHLLRLVWRRKRASALVVVEMFASFLVLVAVLTLGAYLWSSARRPLGFRYENVLSVRVDRPANDGGAWSPERADAYRRIETEARNTASVSATAWATDVPFDSSTMIMGRTLENPERNVDVQVSVVEDGFAQALGITLAAGRWFEPADATRADRPVVLNREAALALFGTTDVIGRNVPYKPSADGAAEPAFRVIGLVAEYRKGGELMPGRPYMLRRLDLGKAEMSPRRLLVTVPGGASAAFEEGLVSKLRAIAPDLSFDVQPLARMRASSMRLQIVPVIVGATIGGFLLLMVALGLFGVLWQNVTQRTREIGLRRAAGATAADVHRQIIAEVLIVASLGIVAGLLLVVQVPALGLLGFLDRGTLAAGTAAAALAIYALAVGCALYPSWLAARVRPAEALHYE